MKNKKKLNICSRCVMDTSDALLTFNNNNICDYCLNFEKNILPTWKKNLENVDNLEKISFKIKQDTKGHNYNCIIGISGGVDSSFVAYVAKEIMGLNPLLFHVDAGWNSSLSVSNIEKLIEHLDLDLHTEVVDWDEMRDLQLAFFKSGVPHLDTPQDHAFFAGLYNFAKKHKFKYILTGANLSTESIREPLEWHYHATDLKFLLDVHNKFGNKKLNKFPLTDIFKYKIYYRFINNIKIVKPLNYINYIKNDAVKFLQSRYNWNKYPYKHYESRFTSFYEGYWLINRFGFDKRKAHFSSLISSNQMSRADALSLILNPPFDHSHIFNEFEFVASKLDISVDELKKYLSLPKKNFKDYKNNYFLIKLGTYILTNFGTNNILIR